MSLRHSRLTRALCGAVAPLFAGVFFVACGGAAPADQTGTTSQADSREGLFHSGVTKESWHREMGKNHGEWDDERRCHPRSLELCQLLDAQFIGVDAGEACEEITTPACPDRVNTWDVTIVFDFVIAISGDCRFGQWAPPLLTSTDVANYLNDLLAFTLQFFGCPDQTTTGKLTFGLIPSALKSRHFTTADLNALSDAYAAAVAQAFSDNGSPPLTAQQTASMNAKLNQLARRVPGKIRSQNFSFSTCPADAGALGADMTPDDDNLDCR